MERSNRELWLAFIAILAITSLYLFVLIFFADVPRASGFFGHSIGILGFILMLMTETLYSLRKRSRNARWGRMSEWLNFHIFTGIVGPYLVLLHTSWKFNGLAGIVTLLTVIIVVSGFIGRYIYTAVPRTANGVALESTYLEEQIAAADAEVQRWIGAHPELFRLLELQPAAGLHRYGSTTAVPLGRAPFRWRQRFLWWQVKRRMEPAVRAQAGQLEKLLRRQRLLRRQVASLIMARRMLAIWHAVHIPIGMALFASAFIHIAAALYYATLSR